MIKPRLPMVIPSQDELLNDVPVGIFDDSFRFATERLDCFIGASLGELADGLALPVGPVLTPESLLAERGYAAGNELALRWLLENLELFGYAASENHGWRLVGKRPTSSSIELRAQAESLLPATRPAYEMISLAMGALPAVLRGEMRGEDVLFGPSTMSLWFEYMSNSNIHYGANNAVTAAALVPRLSPGAKILEVGGGGGGAAQAILMAIAREGKTPSRYVFTDIHPAFLRRGTRVIQQSAVAGCEIKSERYDINLAPEEQGAQTQSFDAVVAVNTLHLARNVVLALGRLRSLLRPGGVLVIGELIRPAHGAVPLELPFLLLEAYRQVELDPEIRPRPGFMKSEGWTTAFARAGFSDIELRPNRLAECVEGYPGFFCGAITGVA